MGVSLVFRGMERPNIDSGWGEAEQSTYCSLYDHARTGNQSSDQRIACWCLRPSSMRWVDAVIKHCVDIRFLSIRFHSRLGQWTNLKTGFGLTRPDPRDDWSVAP